MKDANFEYIRKEAQLKTIIANLESEVLKIREKKNEEILRVRIDNLQMKITEEEDKFRKNHSNIRFQVFKYFFSS